MKIQPAEQLSLDKTSVMIVEDEAIIAADLSGKLGQLGYQVVGTAAEGNDALEMACRLEPQVVLMDIRLRGALDGIETAEAIRRRIDVPVLYLTAHSDAATLARAKLTGPFGYILKPFEERELATAIEMALHKHQSERQLREQREMLGVFIEHAPASLAMFDRQMRYLYVSRRWRNDYHIGERDLQGASHYEVFPEISEEWKQIHRRCLAGEVIRSDSDRFVRADGSVQWLRWEVRPWRDARGEVAGIVVFSEDITERKRVEEALKEREGRLRRAEEMAHLGHWRYDLATGRINWSDEMYRIFGFQGHAGPAGLTLEEITEFCHPDDREHYLNAFDPSCRHDDDFFEYRLVRPDGEERHVVSKGELVRDESGAVVALFGTLLDTTELRRKERELQEKNAELERFTYMISHDLKSPLVTLRTFLDYLDKDMASSDAGRVEQDLYFMRTAAERMWRLLDELLEMTRIGRTTNAPERIGCVNVVEEALNLVAGSLAERGVEVRTALPAITFFGDRPRLVEIWQNLLENACKFMGDQPHPHIEIGARGLGRETVFFVQDNGVGIEAQYHEKVFGLFEKLDQTIEGTGLGLALVKRIVELNGGKIRVESQGRGRGTCFLFTLPGAINEKAKGADA